MRRMLTAMAALIILLSSCSAQSGGGGGAYAEWLRAARLDAAESPEELYGAALFEDALRVHSNSTRILDVKKTFEARYPGLVVEVTEMRGSDMLGQLADAHSRGEFICDLMICADNNGVMARELVPQGVIVKYVPWDMEGVILPRYNQECLAFFDESQIVFYNSQAGGPPPENWWRLTEPAYRGKVYLSNPLKSLSVYALLCTFIANSGAMAESYRALYGRELAVPEGSDAGREFIRMLMKNGAVLVNSSDEVAAAVGMPGQGDPPVGIMITSKVRANDMGYSLEGLYHMEPFAGTHSPDCVMMVAGAKSVSAAKLFVRWLLGEADGSGEGYGPYLHNGSWSVRTDVDSPEPLDMESLSLVEFDRDFAYKNRAAFEEFWVGLLEEAGA